jgi:hypothetical protein
VLADAHPARPGRQEAGCGRRASRRRGPRNLAGLHAPFWNSKLLDAESSWLQRADDAAMVFVGDLHVAATGEFVERYQAGLSSQDADTLRDAAELTYRWGAALVELLGELGVGHVTAIDRVRPAGTVHRFVEADLSVEAGAEATAAAVDGQQRPGGGRWSLAPWSAGCVGGPLWPVVALERQLAVA